MHPFCLTYGHRETSKAFLESKHRANHHASFSPIYPPPPSFPCTPSHPHIQTPPLISTHQLWITYRFCFPSRFWYVLHKHSWRSNRHDNWIMRWMVDDSLRLPHPVTSPVWIRWSLRLVSCSYEILWLSDLCHKVNKWSANRSNQQA